MFIFIIIKLKIYIHKITDIELHNVFFCVHTLDTTDTDMFIYNSKCEQLKKNQPRGHGHWSRMAILKKYS